MKKKYFFLLLINCIFVSICCFARDGQIDIEELIKRREVEQQNIEKISSVLNQITEGDKKDFAPKLNSFIRNEDDEIVKFDDSSDEINLEYFINIFNDNVFRKAVTDFINNASGYIKGKSEQNNVIELPYSVIPFIFSILAALILCSVSTITGKEASVFPMVIKDAESDWKTLDKKIDKLEEKKIIPLQVKKYKPVSENNNANTINATLEDSYGYDYDSWLRIGNQAMLNLESFSNNQEFKNVYNHYHKNSVLSGHILEDALSEADCAETSLMDIDDKNNSLLILFMKSKMTNKYAGSETNGLNSIANQTDFAYISVFSDNADNSRNNDESKDFWSSHAWV